MWLSCSRDISLEEKIQHMVKWYACSLILCDFGSVIFVCRWEGNHELMIGERIKRSQLKEMVANANIQFRYVYAVSTLIHQSTQ